jgi:hypothetical protein
MNQVVPLNYALQDYRIILPFELIGYSIWISLLTELSKPCTLSITNMHIGNAKSDRLREFSVNKEIQMD